MRGERVPVVGSEDLGEHRLVVLPKPRVWQVQDLTSGLAVDCATHPLLEHCKAAGYRLELCL